jgi:hypothetical protein
VFLSRFVLIMVSMASRSLPHLGRRDVVVAGKLGVGVAIGDVIFRHIPSYSALAVCLRGCGVLLQP